MTMIRTDMFLLVILRGQKERVCDKMMFNGRMIEGEGWMQQMSEGENSL